MGRGRKWEQPEWQQPSSGRWQIWDGAWPKTQRPSTDHKSVSFPKYDAASASHAGSKGGKKGGKGTWEDASAQLGARDTWGWALQDGLNTARKAETRVRHLAQLRETKLLQWKSHEAELKRHYLAEKQRHKKDVARLDEELAAALQNQEHARAQVVSVVLSQQDAAGDGEEPGSLEDANWEQMTGEWQMTMEHDSPEAVLRRAMAATRGPQPMDISGGQRHAGAPGLGAPAAMEGPGNAAYPVAYSMHAPNHGPGADGTAPLEASLPSAAGVGSHGNPVSGQGVPYLGSPSNPLKQVASPGLSGRGRQVVPGAPRLGIKARTPPATTRSVGPSLDDKLDAKRAADTFKHPVLNPIPEQNAGPPAPSPEMVGRPPEPVIAGVPVTSLIHDDSDDDGLRELDVEDWHDAVHKVEEMVNANHPPSQVPDELSSSTVCPPPMCQACPWTPITGDEGPEFTKCHFRVMSPRYQDEYVYLDMRIPGVTSDEAIREVQDCLVSLRLSFAKSLVPTTPQMNAGYATLILRGSWHSQYGDVIVVFDFRKLGGPSYAKRCCLVGTFYEIRQEALKHGFGHWDVYLFGGNEPLQPGARFRMVHGGVIQYCPAGYRPTWHGTFDSKFFAKRYWQESPLLLAVKPRAILLLGIGTTAFHDPADPDAPSLAQAAGLMVSRDEWHITLTPPSPGTQLDALWRGHICAGVLAVENHAPPASSVDERLCIFIDARQVGQRLVCTWVGHPDVPIDYLARFANVHRLPVGYHLSIARATPSALVNHIRVSNGDVVVLGFRSEDDSDFGSDPQESDRDDPDEDPDASTTKPDSASESDSPAPESTQGNGSSADSGRSRSPHRQGRLHGVCCFLGSCSVLSRAALRVLKQTLACSFRRMCMWTGCDRLQDAFPDGLAQLTPASLSDRKTMTFEPLCMKASPPPTLPQRLAAPAGEWRDLPGTGNAHHNEEELATIDAFLEPVQVDEDPDSSDEESDGSGRMATFLVLVPDCIPEQVEVWIDQALDERDVVDLVNDERNHQRYLLFSCLRPVWPQPARHWGALLAFPPWAETEHIACFDTRSLDGRLFAIGVPQVATREQFCSLAGGLDPFVISVFPYGSDRPLGPNELANFVAGGLVVLSPGSSFSPGPWGQHYCCVQEGGHRAITHDRSSDPHIDQACARALQLHPDTFLLETASPAVTDVAVKGVHCADIVAVVPHEAWAGEIVPTVVFLDCRPLLQGFSITLAEAGQVCYSSLMDDLDTFTPGGWQLQLDPISVDEGFFGVTPGCTITASYVPLSSDEEEPSAVPWEGYDSRRHHDDDGPPPDDDGDDPAPPEIEGTHSPPRSRSPVRNRQDPDAAPSACLPHRDRKVLMDGAFFARSGLLLGTMLAIAWLSQNPGVALLWCQILQSFRIGGGFLLLLKLKVPFPLVLVGWLLASSEFAYAVQTRPPPAGFELSRVSEAHRDCVRDTNAHSSFLPAAHHTSALTGHRRIPTPCRNLPRSTEFMVLHDLRTLLEDSVAQPASQAFFLASTLLEVLEEHFHPVDCQRDMCHEHPLTLELDRLLPSPDFPCPTPDFYDHSQQCCRLPGDPDLVNRIFDRAPFSQLPRAPGGLYRPERFLSWLSQGCAGRSPAPNETLVVTSDGSHNSDSGTTGWGVTFSLRSHPEEDSPGEFVGCLCGSLIPFLPFLDKTATPDAYDAEVAGLLWSAVALLQLPVSCRVLVRADNVAALGGVQGTMGMRASALCLAARALHASVAIMLPGNVGYAHVRGHAGEPSNEMADALARRGSEGLSVHGPFFLDVPLFLAENASVAQWLPHLCLSRRDPAALPRQHEHFMTWTRDADPCVHPPEFSMRPFLRAFPDSGGPSVADAEGTPVGICLASYNALSLLDGSKDSQAGLHGAVGRPTLLQRSFHSVDVRIAGVQECRTPAGRMQCGDYVRFSSGCDQRSCFGVELWVHEGGPCQASSVVVLHNTPTILVASAKVAQMPIKLLVGHAPHRGHTSEVRCAGWRNIAHLCHSFSHGDPWIFLLDANCRVGSRESMAVGGHHADPEDDAGLLFHDLLMELGLCAPSTFSAFMTGPGGTLRQKRNGDFARSDFVCIPVSWTSGICHAWVEPGISAGHSVMDHVAPMLSLAFRTSLGSHASKRAARPDAGAIADPENASVVHAILQQAPRPSWQTDVHEHAAEVVDYLYTQLVQHFPLNKKRLRASFLSDSSATLHQAVSALRHAVRAKQSALRLTYLRCAFQSWCSPETAFDSLFSGTWLWRLRTRLGGCCMLLRRFGRQLREQCRRDKSLHLAKLADEVATAPSGETHRAVKRILRPKKFRRTAADPLPVLEKPDGSLCTTATEVAESWREYFRVLEGGLEVTDRELVQQCRHAQSSHEGPDILDSASMPTWLSLEAAFRHSAPRKASGPDLVPPSICRAFAPQLAELFWPLLLKTICRSCEPIGLKGGVMFHISKGKPGSQRTCSSHRGILAQSCLSKVFHRSLRGLVVQHWQKFALPLQLGGRVGCSAVFGHLCSRSVLCFARKLGLSAGLLFVDLQAAYYAVVRETILGGGLVDRPVPEIASALGLDSEDLQILKHFAEEEPILQSQGVNPLLLSLARELHRQTWFVLAEDPSASIVATQRGTRPGGTLADVLFNVLFAKVLARRQTDPDAFPMVPWEGTRTPFPTAQKARAPKMRISDVVYADDLCTPACFVCGDCRHDGHSHSARGRGHLRFGSYGIRLVILVPPDQELLTALTALSSATDQEIFDLVSSFIAPLPMLRQTIITWMESLPAGDLAEAASDVLLILRPEHICSSICGWVVGQPVMSSFIPDIKVPVYRPPGASLPVKWFGGLDADWVSRWNLRACPTFSMPLGDLLGAPLQCNGFCIRFPVPPGHAVSFSPASMPLRELRSQIEWLSLLLRTLPCLLGTASLGIPVSLFIPVEAAAAAFKEQIDVVKAEVSEVVDGFLQALGTEVDGLTDTDQRMKEVLERMSSKLDAFDHTLGANGGSAKIPWPTRNVAAAEPKAE
ncbi:unnamed protein product, partial [Symbiodinium sp. KB8]